MNKSNFNKYFRGFHFIDCAVRDRNTIYLLSRQEYELEDGQENPEEYDVPKRLINVLLDEPEAGRYGSSLLTGFSVSNVEVAHAPKAQAVLVDYGRQVYVMGSGDDNMESDIALDTQSGPSRGGTTKLRTIGGKVYAVGLERNICRREGPNHWGAMWNGLPLP